VLNKFEEMGASFQKGENYITISGSSASDTNPLRAAVIRTGLYPNLATDLQPPFGVLATQCRGTSVIHDWIYEGRFGYLNELAKMGANVRKLDSHQAEISGPTKLSGTELVSMDIRAGMTMVIAALVADGESVVKEIHHIDRGYERLDERLRSLGAKIERVE